MSGPLIQIAYLLGLALLPLACVGSCDQEEANVERLPVPADSFCTRDINSYGHPSMCGCPDTYTYDAKQRSCYRTAPPQ
jgi:hypothetical protein